MRVKKYLVFITIFFVLFSNSFSLENIEELEETYVQLKIKKLRDDFFLIKYDSLNDKIYIGVNALLYFMQIYSLNVNLESRRIEGKINEKKIDVKLAKKETFIDSKELYVSLEELKKALEFEYIDYNPLILSIDAKPRYILPYEIKEKGKIERLRLQNKNGAQEEVYDIKSESKLIRPGMLKLYYSRSDIEKSEYSLGYEYGTELLYGEFYMNGDIKPNSQITTAKLKYLDLWKENDIVLGTNNLNTPNFIKGDSDIIGISINSEDTYSKKEDGTVIIRGEVVNVDSIELYRNNILVDYTIPISNQFEFRVEDGSLSSTYLLKIYHHNGKIEERWVYSLGDEKALQKGKSKFTLQSGKNRRDGKFQNIAMGYYGLNDNLTLGVGSLNLKDRDGNSTDIVEGNIIFNSRVPKFPTLINIKEYYDVREREKNLNLTISQNIYDYSIKYSLEKYSSTTYKSYGVREENNLSLSKSFSKSFVEVGIGKAEKEKDEKRWYVNYYNSYFQPFSATVRYEERFEEKNKFTSLNPAISYSGLFNMIVEGNFEKDEQRDKKYQSYSIRLSKRQLEIIKDRLYGSVGLEANYSPKKKWSYGISFNLELEDIINFQTYTRTTIDEDKKRVTSTGLTASKVLTFNNKLANISNESTVNSYTIYGRVFFDKNGDGIFNEGDEALEGVEVLVGNKGVKSNSNGEYIAVDISNNEIVEVDINRKTIDVMLNNTQGKKRVKIKNNQVLKYDIPIEVVSMISGNIWSSGDITERDFTKYMATTTISLKREGKPYREIEPEFDGLYFVEDLPPGRYEAEFLYLGQENIEFVPNKLSIDIVLQNSEEGEYLEGYDTKIVIKEVEKVDTYEGTDLLEEFEIW